ncbi:MAG: hypothetical protein JW844_00760 [Candidatus Omnitrophica bacterium]|nr:hypothetical protein [Candidatus Omnitrophota bacterium]
MPTQTILTETKKDILLSLLKYEQQEVSELIAEIETNQSLEREGIRDFFTRKSRVEDQALKSILTS